MSITDAVLATFAATITLIVIIVFAYRGVRTVKRYAREILQAVRDNTAAAVKAGGNVAQVVQELAYMRNLTQQVVAVQPVQETPPPVGREGRMPSAFPVRPLDTYVQDAKPEDTDQSLINQTEGEVVDAQAREEMRAHGIEPMDDEEPQRAVGEEA